MRLLAAGVTLVTTASDEGGRAGLTATAVCSVSAEPPQLLVCVNRGAEAHDLLMVGGRLAVSLLDAAQSDLADLFAGRTGVHGEGRFEAGRWTTLTTGAPVLADGLACFDCRVTSALPAGSHTIFLARVLATSVRFEPGAPLAYLDGGYGRVDPLPGADLPDLGRHQP